MGLTHSSAVVDSCLFTLAAIDWAARVYVQLAHAVKMFVRLRDDIFIVTSDLAKFSRVFRKVPAVGQQRLYYGCHWG